MHVAPHTLRLLYVSATETDRGAPRESLDFEESTVSVAVTVADLETRLAAGDVDCLLVSETAVEAFWEDLRHLLAVEYPSVPAVVFTGGLGPAVVDEVLGVDGVDVVQSTVAETPASLVRRRLDGAVGGETGLAGSLERLETIFNTAADAIYQLDTGGTIVAVNDAAVALTGYDRAELVGEHVSLLLDESTIHETERHIREQLRGDEDVTTVEMDVRTNAGGRVPCETRIAVLQAEDTFIGSVGVVRDVSEKRERERQLERTQELLANSERLADVGAWEIDVESDSLSWSDGTRRIHEVPDDFDPTVENAIAFFHPDDREEIARRVEACIEEGTPYDVVLRIVTAEGNDRLVRTQGEPVEENGEVHTVRGFVQDVTERKARERELQEERDIVQRIYETSPIGIAVLDGEGIVRRANDRAADIVGVAREAMLGKTYGEIPFDVFDADGDPVPPAQFPASRAIRTGEPRYNDEVLIRPRDGEDVWASFNCAPVVEDGTVTQVVATIEDVTERKSRERQIADQRDELATLDRINSIIREVDEALLEAESEEEILQAVCTRFTEFGRYQFALALEAVGDRLETRVLTADAVDYAERAFPMTDVTAANSPVVRARETGNVEVVRDVSDDDSFETAPWREGALAAGVRSLAAVPLRYDGHHYGAIAVYATEPDAFSPRELAVLDELGGTVGHAIAAVESREREAILTSLYEATQDLLAAEDRQAVSEAVVETASSVLEPSGVGLFLFDEGDNVLRPAAATDELLEFYDDSVVFGPGREDSATWQAYATGETREFDDVRESDAVVNPETDARGTLLVPLGRHGVFVVASTTVGAFDDRKQRLIGLLAATTEAALDRVAGRAGIRERDEELARRSDRLDRLEHVLTCLRDVDDLVQRAGTREEIERGVCDRLSRMDQHTFAWIGTLAPDGDSLRPQAWSGADDGYLDTAPLDVDSDEPAVSTAVSGEPTVVSNVTAHLQSQPWARVAADRNFQSAAAVPLVYGETTYGVLALYADEPDAFAGTVADVLPELGQRIAHGINTVETKRGILAEQFTELELELDDPGDFLNAVAEAAGEEVSYREITPTGAETARVLFVLDDPPVEDVLALESTFVTVTSLSHTDRGDEHVFRATLSGRTVAGTLLDCGAIPQEVVATPSVTRAVLRLPQELDVRVFLDRVRETYPSAQLRRRADAERGHPDDRESVRVALEEHLTERQREVLLTAYESGFFQSPRETTGAELAEMLDISQPTVTHHLREAQHRLFTALFDGVE